MNLSIKKVVYLISILILYLPTFALTQNKDAELLEEMRNAYHQLDFTEAEIKAKSALNNYQRFSAEQLTEIHKILALIYYSQNQIDEARQHFKAALSLTPDLNLDPLFVSPKIIDFYNQIKEERRLTVKNNSNAKAEVRYVLVQDPRPAAALRSMILPGWGQLYKGEKTKGRLLMALWGVGITGSVISHLAREQAKDKYLSETNPAKIESRYNTFNNFHKLRNNLVIFSAGVWVYSYIDSILKERPHKIEKSASKKALVIFPSISPDYAQVNFIMTF
ncbi:MAG: tetratricopeptide repeat protein [bacterium]